MPTQKMKHYKAFHPQTAAELLPVGSFAKKLLESRALQFAIKKIDETTKVELITYIQFRLGAHEYYGIPYEHTQEVLSNISVTPLPHLPNFVEGVINYRGKLLTIINLKNFFHLPQSEQVESQIIVVGSKGITIGILADDIIASISYAKIELDNALPSENIKTEYIIGIHDGNTTLLNIHHLILDIQQLLSGKNSIA